MPRRRVLTQAQLESLLALPTTEADLVRHWTLDRGDLAADEAALLRLLRRWQEEATKAGHPITRITLAFEAGRDGFWLARWLRAHGIEAHVIHPTSVAVSREHRRAKSDRLDTAL